VELFGWIQKKREHGGVVFIDLRDRSGIVQLVFNEEWSKESFDLSGELRTEFVIKVYGEVRQRENPNPKIPTGWVEVWVSSIELLNEAKTSPIEIVKQGEVSEETRLRYRYLDLRRSEMKENIIMRHRVTSAVRNYLNEQGYIDIETPFLTKSTPEGARDFLVPSRMNRGKFFALPQSPQIFKQLLMIAGFDKYYQIVRCFRDEDLRADRQPEFTQIDIEASFIEQKDIYTLIDGMFERILTDCYGTALEIPFPRYTFDLVMEQYGSDRPDLRYPLKIKSLDELSQYGPKEFIADGLKGAKKMYGLAVPLTEKITRKVLDSYGEQAKKEGVSLFSWLKNDGSTITGPLQKLFSKDTTPILGDATGEISQGNGYALLFAMGEPGVALPFMGAIRQKLVHITEVRPEKKLAFVWVTDFPLFERNEEEDRYTSVHHPFTSPKDDLEKVKKNPLAARSKSYDLVLNGIELGGGSMRIHKSEIQREIFSLLGLKQEEWEKKFGFLLEALDYGAPPHGGIAFGLDRIVMMLQGKDSIRDVIPFPKTTSGLCPLTGAPEEVGRIQLDELGIRADTIKE
jgi:aspartyl-tRNA synthetase